jgi:hypothetical protein
MSLPDHPSFPVAPPRLDEFSISQSAMSPLEACSGFRKHFCEFQPSWIEPQVVVCDEAIVDIANCEALSLDHFG